MEPEKPSCVEYITEMLETGMMIITYPYQLAMGLLICPVVILASIGDR